jgi:endogenous inhibitor of DNA gyrase (YacG/DUF329 family)
MSNKPARCPVCRKPVSAENRPFCSPVCRDRDLLQWLGEGYRVPGRPQDEPQEDRED